MQLVTALKSSEMTDRFYSSVATVFNSFFTASGVLSPNSSPFNHIESPLLEVKVVFIKKY